MKAQADQPGTSTYHATSSVQELSDMFTKPLNHGLQDGLIKKTERLEQWKVGSTFSVQTQFQDPNRLEQECATID